ncbi:three-Cys-motif partner protein TcmP [Leptonema illini]|uniref:Three-Cys-motif partner protein TcmP n=1 Tax=Leptonema illini DSM 21528 TaxID=929563 RepID=H2CC13_9LEPT|nr:three-Cys-motif partner protein TcmP [Leptonema illini]EHQ08685.1 hypothetical protein Lepil_4037 [Leptonema illini DSM 21528]
MNAATHRFGGSWTERKLAILKKYLGAYNQALKKQPFRKMYVDAFAGSGSIEQISARAANAPSLFDDIPIPTSDSPEKMLEGSASIALQISPPFDEWVFIEKNANRCADLERLRGSYPDLAPRIQIRRGEANEELKNLCEMDWSSTRAVMFLDPYGMQVEWQTIEKIAQTQAVDMWLLFPLGIGLNRTLPRSGDIPTAWIRRINLFLGTDEWYEEFYTVEHNQDIFGQPHREITKARIEVLARFFIKRLEEIFPGVAPNPAVLSITANNPMYLFCFAAANARGAKIALNIAKHLLNKI